MLTVPPASADLIPVADIINGPTNAVTGTPLTLNASVMPPEAAAANPITWGFKNAATTGAAITGSTFNATVAGTYIVTATAGAVTREFNVIVDAAFVPVTGITGIPANHVPGSFLLEGVVEPANATNKGIEWAVVNAGTTGAAIVGNRLSTNVNASGTVDIRATIANGLSSSTPYTEVFTIIIETQTITSASISVPAPETYGLRPETAVIPTNANYSVTTVAWRVGTTSFNLPSFEGNRRYSVDITIAANPGFVFAEGNAFVGNIGTNRATLARNANGTITLSHEFPATRDPRVLPTAPQNFAAEPGNKQVRLTWTAPQSSGTGGGNIARYQISWGLSDGYVRNWETITNSGPNTTSFTVTGLENDKEYNFEIRAVNSNYGGGIASALIRSTPVGTATVPQNFRVSPGNGNVFLSWTPPSFTGGTIIGYEFSYGPAGSYVENWLDIPRTGTGNIVPLNYLLEEVTNGVEYTFQIRAVNENGEGVASERVNALPAVNALAAPRSFSAASGNEQVVLSWTAPLTNGNVITKYQYSQVTTSGNPTWRDIPDSGPGTTSFTVTGLTNGTTYFFEVRALAGTNNAVMGATSGVRIATPNAPVANTTTSVDSRAADIQTAANNGTGQTITVNMSAGSNSISKPVLDSMSGKNINLVLDYGTVGRIAINGSDVNAANGAATLNLNLQRASGTAAMLADYSIPKGDIDARYPLPVHQLKIGTGASVAIKGTVTVSIGTDNSGSNAILCSFNSETKQFEVAGSAVIGTNGNAAIGFIATGDFLIIVQQDGDVTGTGTVDTGDALEILRAVAGMAELDDVQLYVASTRRDGTVGTGDAMAILRRVAGLTVT
jgi:hypothetical protein